MSDLHANRREISYLARNGDRVELLVADGAPLFVFIVEDQRYARFGTACLALLVDKLLQIANTNLKREQIQRQLLQTKDAREGTAPV
jgi:hypothetical protein